MSSHGLQTNVLISDSTASIRLFVSHSVPAHKSISIKCCLLLFLPLTRFLNQPRNQNSVKPSSCSNPTPVRLPILPSNGKTLKTISASFTLKSNQNSNKTPPPKPSKATQTHPAKTQFCPKTTTQKTKQAKPVRFL